MPEDAFTRRSQVAVDWDIKNTPRFLYYMLVDSKALFLEEKRARGIENPKRFAKYVSDLYMLYYSVQVYFDLFLDSLTNEDNPLELSPLDYEALAYDKVNLDRVMKLDKMLCRWLFSQGPFKTDSEEKFYDDIAEQLDDERSQY